VSVVEWFVTAAAFTEPIRTPPLAEDYVLTPSSVQVAAGAAQLIVVAVGETNLLTAIGISAAQ